MSGKPSPRFQTSETRKPGRPHPTQPRPGGPPGPLSPLAAAPAAALRAGREEGPGRGTGLARSSSESVSEPTEGLATAQARVSAAETSRSPPKESQLLCRQYIKEEKVSVRGGQTGSWAFARPGASGTRPQAASVETPWDVGTRAAG